MSRRILLVEDEKNVGSTLLEKLKREGFEVAWAQTATEAASQVKSQVFDLALLDVGLPDGSGFDVGQAIRDQSPRTAIVFLTAFGSPEDRVKGLELGAEDYIVKPFHLKELSLRIQNALKRAKTITDDIENQSVLIGSAQIDFSQFRATRNGVQHSLTHKECSLLRYLFLNRGKVLSRDEILNEIWSSEEFPTTRTIDNFILKLRKIIEEDPENPQVIKSVRGVGYQLI